MTDAKQQGAAAWRVLVVGGGGREHALVRACRASARVEWVVAAPGNAGIAAEVPCWPLAVEDIDGLVARVRAERVNLVVVGPEVPLALGLADRLREAGVAVFGPGAVGAELEASKVRAKAFINRHGIPTAGSATFTEVAPALAHMAAGSFPVVIKASGLAAGKGVIIAADAAEAEAAIRLMLEDGVFGQSGAEVLVEDFLTGEEASIMVVTDGREYVLLPASQDHKRVGEGDTGPNTGGMGAYAPAAVVTPQLEAEIRRTVVEPSLRGLQDEGIDYRGVLYVGVMVTPDGPKVLEFNCRFGDPECQVLLPLLESDPVELLAAVAQQRLDPATVHLRKGAAAVVVLAAEGYPGPIIKGRVLDLPAEADLPAGGSLIHAGTSTAPDGAVQIAGGRVLGAVGLGADLESALAVANAVADAAAWPGCVRRRDIGWRQCRKELRDREPGSGT